MKVMVGTLAVAITLFAMAVVTQAAPKPAEPQTLRVRSIDIVDEDGNTVGRLGTYNGVTGLWIGHDSRFVSIVKEKGIKNPYIGFGDTRSPGWERNRGCNLAFTLDEKDSNPIMQVVGPDHGNIQFIDLLKLKK